MNRDEHNEVCAYIVANWDSTVRTDSTEPRLPLPKPYTVPCASGRFQDLYYWDTYFANLGLLRSDRVEQAKNNVDNFLYEVETYGFVPNSNATYHLNRSQPPYLSLMIRDIYDATQELEWVAERLDTLEKEYRFWMTERMTASGLNRHYHRATDAEKVAFYDVLMRRLRFPEADEETRRKVSDHYIAEAETGHDFTPRFGGRCADNVPVDLNALLACYENNFCYFSERSGWSDSQRWEDAWSARRRRVDALLWTGERYADYNYVTKQHSPVTSAASMFPLWAGLATNEQAGMMVAALQNIDEAHGIATCPKQSEGPGFQWGYPNGWPPMQYAVVGALLRYGYEDRARHIASKYLDLVTSVFRDTGSLWEKYDVAAGAPASGEYEAARMMGWTAGVFQALYEVVWGAV